MKYIDIGSAGGRAFSLPLEAVTQTIAILAKRGVGKSYTASVMAEGMLAAGQQVVILDPTGAWWGLKSCATGKEPGYQVTVFGGDHADLPLRENAGELIARAIVERRFPAIIDLSLFRKGQARRFVTAFLETLYRLNRDPLHLIVDEADDIAPQRPQGDEAAMLGAIEDVVKRGRKKGIGCTLITQRPADLAKQVLTQCEMLVTLRIVHPRDIAAIKEWINVHAEPSQAATMIESLPSLPVGTAWFWSPGWGDFFERIAVRKRTTFDSSATPKPGQKVAAPKTLAAIDVEKLGAEIASMAEQAKADDPKELKRRLAELERLQAKLTAPSDSKRSKDWAAMQKQHKEAIDALNTSQQGLLRTVRRLQERLEKIGALAAVGDGDASPLVKVGPAPRAERLERGTMPIPAPRPAPARSSPPSDAAVAGTLSKAERKILVALFWTKDDAETTPAKVGFYAGYSHQAGGFNNALSRLRNAFGYVTGWTLTAEGEAAAAQMADPKPSGPELRKWLRKKLSKAENEILDVLVDAAGDRLSATQIAEKTASRYSANAGGFNNALARLRSLEAAVGYDRDGGTRAHPAFFE